LAAFEAFFLFLAILVDFRRVWLIFGEFGRFWPLFTAFRRFSTLLNFYYLSPQGA
jgi:hypothetical protein